MRIGLICDWYAPRVGGIEVHLEALASRLIGAGHEVHVITSTPGPVQSAAGAQVHRLKAARLPGAGVVVEPAFIEEIDRVLRTHTFDLVHSHVSIVAPVAIGGALVANRLAIPSVVTFHSFVPATPLWARLTGLFVGSAEWSSIFTAVSSRVASEVSTFAPGQDVHVLPNAIDEQFWIPDDRAPAEGPLTLLYAGRLHPKKRPELALRTMRELRARFRERPLRLRVIGTGPLEGGLRKRAEADGLADVVDFLGWRDSRSLRDLLRDADVFLSPAVRESFGIAALEARATGLPVVAMKESAVAEFIGHGESGLLAASDADFVEAVATLAGDDSLRQSIRDHNCRTRPALTWDRSVREHLILYQAAVSKAGRAA